jgi:predicted CoA-substrate-specific enzyme activase
MFIEKEILSAGICIGSSTISIVKMSGGILPKINSVEQFSHEGNPKELLKKYFANKSLKNYSVIVTGRKFKNIINATSVPEPKCIESALRYTGLAGQKLAIASLGAENFMVYCVNERGGLENVMTGNKCASGTGEFFLQQISRMNITVDEAVNISENQEPYSVSGRCSVFCKSDCTHALNKGIPMPNVVSGLSKMIADKTVELLSKQKYKKVIIIGGVSKNKSVLEFIKKDYPEAFVPEQSSYFEALGAAIEGLNKNYKFDSENVFKEHSHQFSFHKSLQSPEAKVIFKTIEKSDALDGDVCILGLDVGSTTTKAVILRKSDDSMVASVYLRTNGNPVKASVECYKELKKQISSIIKIVGVGVTGSGRHIASLHAITDGDINEIISHAVAAAFFDEEVDTIFEIGGQDAKYTHLTSGVASDYAMNEACSAGTGSFLEEAAKESLNIHYTEISDIAFKAKNPINFNDQCAAFISSDIKNAGHEGANQEDIVSGLVYSICLNYVNRVKGNRPVGNKVFMQGGVCYNKAVPYAMSLLTGKEIIVPPEPGLMGAFGVALEIKNRIELGLYEEKSFDLDELINREFKYSNSFTCAGGKEKCDLKCNINMVEINGKKYPFGGACSKYYNERRNISADAESNNLVKVRQDFVFNKYLIPKNTNGKRIGISRSLLTNTMYPFYFNLFTKLGFEVILSDEVDKSGSDKIRSSYCHPIEISHGFFQNLISKQVDYIFIPHIGQMEGRDKFEYNRMCVFVQGETYFLKSTFREEIEAENSALILSPVLDFSKGLEKTKDDFLSMFKENRIEISNFNDGFSFALDSFNKMKTEYKERGKQILKEIESNPDEIALVLFGRPYNAFAQEANLNIPHKIASHGYKIIPYDFLPYDEQSSYENMYWYSGNEILSAARFVKEHKQLFGVFITNFSCGPDSFIIPYFRKIMGVKPSLTLELDSHTADVGVETRIEAAVDIIKNYLLINKETDDERFMEYDSLKVISRDNSIYIKHFSGEEFPIKSDDVEVLIPSMGRFSTEAFAAVFRSLGVNCRPLPVPTFETLKQGRGVATCKECLPFLLTTGSLLEYLKGKNGSTMKTLFFMPHGYGPCRQGQYHTRLKDILQTSGITNSGVISMDDESSFSDFGNDFFISQWLSMTIADTIHDIENAINVLAIDKDYGMKVLNDEWNKVVGKFESGDKGKVYKQLEELAVRLSEIPLKSDFRNAKVVSLIGEIYVRREEYSRLDLIKVLTENGFIVKTAPITEYIYYTNYLQKNNIVKALTPKEKIELFLKEKIQHRIERKVKKILAKSNLCSSEMIDVEKTISYGKDLVSDRLIGESILTVGLSLREILDESCGIITIGPFNCIPSRLAEGILSKEMTLDGKYRFGKLQRNGYPESVQNLPYLHIETDGNTFPQITQSKIEIFMVQSNKLYDEMKLVKSKHH